MMVHEKDKHQSSKAISLEKDGEGTPKCGNQKQQATKSGSKSKSTMEKNPGASMAATARYQRKHALFIRGFVMVEKNMKSSQALVSGLQKTVKAVKEADPNMVWYVYNDQSKGEKVLAKESNIPKIPSKLKEFFSQWLLAPSVKQNQVWFEGKITMDKDPEVFMMDAAATMELMFDGKIFLKPLQHVEMEKHFMIMNSFIGMNKMEHEECI